MKLQRVAVPLSTAAIAAALALPSVGAVAAPVGAATATTPHCHFNQLTIKAGPGQAGVGHVGFPVRFINHSNTVCNLRAYPGADALNKHGKVNMHAERTKYGYLGGVPSNKPIPTVVLHHGDVASALIEGTDMPTENKKSCPQARAFRVTPPNAYSAKLIDSGLPECSQIEIHPVVPGKSGSER